MLALSQTLSPGLQLLLRLGGINVGLYYTYHDFLHATSSFNPRQLPTLPLPLVFCFWAMASHAPVTVSLLVARKLPLTCAAWPRAYRLFTGHFIRCLPYVSQYNWPSCSLDSSSRLQSVIARESTRASPLLFLAYPSVTGWLPFGHWLKNW